MNSFRVLFVFFTICAIATMGHTQEDGITVQNFQSIPTEDAFVSNPTVEILSSSVSKCYDFFNKINKHGGDSKKQVAIVNFICNHIIASIFIGIFAFFVLISISACVCRCLCRCLCGSHRGYSEFA